MKIVIVGCGWLGLPLAGGLAREGHEVHGTTTRSERLDEIAEQGVAPHRFRASPDVEGPAELFRGADRVVISLPPSRLGDRYADAIGGIVRAARGVGQIVQLSSTGVHPDRPGHPETAEEDVAETPGPRARRLLDAEAAVRDGISASDASADGAGSEAPSTVATILRLAGLWGYGRHPVRYLAGGSHAGGDAPVNLLHRDDAIAAVRAVSLPRPVAGTFAVVAASHPPRGAFYRSEALRLGLPEPRFDEGPSAGKRVQGERLARETGFRPRWQPGDPDAP